MLVQYILTYSMLVEYILTYSMLVEYILTELGLRHFFNVVAARQRSEASVTRKNTTFFCPCRESKRVIFSQYLAVM